MTVRGKRKYLAERITETSEIDLYLASNMFVKRGRWNPGSSRCISEKMQAVRNLESPDSA